jgi:CheY-like chemotaxis protein
MLQRIGYQADVVGNGLEVLAALEKQPYDVVLMDVQMPEMDGLEATHHICQRWTHTLHPRIIAMTANAMQGDRQMCIDAGMDDYITKPIQLEELVKALAKCQGLEARGWGLENVSKDLKLDCNTQLLLQGSKLVSLASSPQSPVPLDSKAMQVIRDMVGEDGEEVIKEVIAAYTILL